METQNDIDGVLVQWGDRLFYPGNRMVKGRGQPRLVERSLKARAAEIRSRIAATIVRRAPQVMVKVTGGGRGMRAIAAHLRYISKNGRLDMEDELGNVERGKTAVRDMAEDWRYGGTLIGDEGWRREAFNIILSMPRGTDPLTVQRAARDFAQFELADHKYVMVLHDHQANPHVHISVRAESKHGRRLNPRKADLSRWRSVFAEKLRDWGIDAEASRQATRGESRNYAPLWRIRAKLDGRERRTWVPRKTGQAVAKSRVQASAAWAKIAAVLSMSSDGGDRAMGLSIESHLHGQEPLRQRVGAGLSRGQR